MRLPAKWFILFSVLLLSACASTPPAEVGTEFTIDELKQRAEIASYAGAHQDALWNYMQVLAKTPEDIDALNGAGESLLAADQAARAENYFVRVLKQDSLNVRAREGRALSWLMQGSYAAAQKSLFNLVDDGVEHWRVWNALGIVSDLFGEYADSVSHYKKAIELSQSRAMLHNNLGYSLTMNRQFKQAEEVLKNALKLAPSKPRIVNNLALAIAWQGRYDEAIQHLILVMDEASANNNVGYVAYLNEQYDDAENMFRKAMRLKPSYYKRAASNLDLTIKKKNSLSPE